MLAYAGPDRAVLEPRWNAMPVLEDVTRPEPHPLGDLRQAVGGPSSPSRRIAGTRTPTRCRRAPALPPTAGGRAFGPSGSLHNPSRSARRRNRGSAAVERVIAAVQEEHLSYLGAPGLRTLAATVELDRGRRDRRPHHRDRHGPRRFGDRDGRGEVDRPAG